VIVRVIGPLFIDGVKLEVGDAVFEKLPLGLIVHKEEAVAPE
jgi:hypothetical protein